MNIERFYKDLYESKVEPPPDKSDQFETVMNEGSEDIPNITKYEI